MAGAEWIAVDWGTSRLRAWAMRGGEALDSATADEGMGALAPDEFEGALLGAISPWLGDRATVIACGMVGARQGWIEAAYGAAPCPALAGALTRAPAKDPRLDVRIAPGVSQADPPDVMRGEETQVAGYLSLHPEFDGVLCLPGTHAKWVHVSAGEIVSFRTFMTGELFALLGRRSVLRHSVGDGPGGNGKEGWDADAFAEAVSATLSRPERLASELFGIRAADLLRGQSKGSARARLSGLLIGAELAATRPYWLGQTVAIIGDAAPCRAYADALSGQGLSADLAGGGDMALAGLAALHERNA